MFHLDPSEGSRHIKDWGLGDVRGGYRISEKREGGGSSGYLLKY